MIVHICPPEKFIHPYINFVRDNFDFKQHIFFILGENPQYNKIQSSSNVIIIKYYRQLFYMHQNLYYANKIILHGLGSEKLCQLLFLQPWLLKKCYWVMWGGDFYFPKTQSWIRKQIIKKCGHFVTYIKGDYKLVKQWYGAKGQYNECFMYPSNLFKEYQIKQKKHKTINIQVGNSAAPTNNHLDIFNKLIKYKDEDIVIYVPLSYGGNGEYVKDIIEKGKKIFGDKLKPITEFMPFDKYLDLLSKIDIATFNHKRQQAMGNTITLLGLGKKVYIRSDITPWDMFDEVGIKLFDIENLNMDLIDENTKIYNIKVVKEYFSKEKYLKQLKKLFEK